MKFWYDCEFVEDGVTIDLVSIGIVAEDDREFYGISADFDQGKLLRNDWLRTNVWPHLPVKHCPPGRRCLRCGGNGTGVGHLDVDHPAVRPRAQLARAVAGFLTAPSVHNPRIELWADYAAYDHVALAQLFGPMIALPAGLPMFTHDVQQYASQLGWKFGPEDEPENAHDALADARQCRARWERLDTMRG
ncbi:hypothetical protein [Saccharothrix sp. HUAS TT1]|uniref:hypothetical protein n=1 Tax=unclassified Saccharothrix TaxID=2593673 RepID=UPI00345B7FEB